MKFLSLIGLVLFVSQAEAKPSVGDKAVYNLTSEAGALYIYTEEVTAIDDVAQVATVHDTYVTGGVTTQDDTIKKSFWDVDVPSEASIADCKSLNGVGGIVASLEDITVKAGTFKACREKKTAQGFTSDIYTAPVPFRLVKFSYTSATGTSSYELVSFVKNK